MHTDNKTCPEREGRKQPCTPLTPVWREDLSEKLQPPQQPPQDAHLPPFQQVLGEWLLASEKVPKLHQKTTTWKQVFSAAANYMTFIMRYGFRIVPTDRALARCPSCPLKGGHLCPHLCDSSWPCCQQACREFGCRELPITVPLHKTHVLIHHGAGAGLFFWLLKELFLTSGDQISPRS